MILKRSLAPAGAAIAAATENVGLLLLPPTGPPTPPQNDFPKDGLHSLLLALALNIARAVRTAKEGAECGGGSARIFRSCRR